MRRAARAFGCAAFTVLAIGGLVGCRSQHVEFTEGRCLIDGQPATLGQVEARQSALSERILRRQPIFVVVTILIVVLAGASHIEKLFVLFSARRVDAQGLGQRLQAALDRYRVHPLRYFSIVGATLALLGMAGGFYVYLDADKRASERALNLLQFCHLALRDSEAQTVLDEQRRNLDAIESTAGSIRALVDKLPPDEQRKAEEIVGRINVAIGRQGKLMGDYLSRSDESMKALGTRTAALEREIATLDAALLGLKSLPADTKEAVELGKQIDRRVSGLDGHAQQTDAKLTVLASSLKDLVARPERACPACVCQGPPPGTHASAPAPTPTPTTADPHAIPPGKDAPASSR